MRNSENVLSVVFSLICSSSSARISAHATVILAFSIVIGLPISASALLIDDFTAGEPGWSTGHGIGTSTGSQTSTSGIGGTRDIYFSVGGPTGSGGSSVGSGGFASLSRSSTVGNYGRFYIWYDGVADEIESSSGTNLNIDLSAGGADRFRLDIIQLNAADHHSPTFVGIRVSDVSLAGTQYVSSGPLDTGAQTVDILFSSFAGIDWTQIDALQILMGVDSGGSMQLGSVTTFAGAPIPEPSTALLLSMGLMGMAFRRRRLHF